MVRVVSWWRKVMWCRTRRARNRPTATRLSERNFGLISELSWKCVFLIFDTVWCCVSAIESCVVEPCCVWLWTVYDAIDSVLTLYLKRRWFCCLLVMLSEPAHLLLGQPWICISDSYQCFCFFITLLEHLFVVCCVLLLLAWPASCLEHGLWNCRASVHLSLCLSVAATAAHLLLWTRRAENIDWLLHGWCSAAAMPQHCAAANVGSATLSADVGSWTQTCKFWSSIYIYTIACFLLNVQCEGTSWYFVVVLLTHILLSVFQSQWWGAGKSEGLQNEQCLHWHDNWLCSSGCSVSATH